MRARRNKIPNSAPSSNQFSSRLIVSKLIFPFVDWGAPGPSPEAQLAERPLKLTKACRPAPAARPGHRTRRFDEHPEMVRESQFFSVPLSLALAAFAYTLPLSTVVSGAATAVVFAPERDVGERATLPRP